MAVLVVELAFLGVAEHVVCFRSFLEFFFGFLVARIFIRVVLDGLFAVCFFYFFGSGRFCHAENLVIVALIIHSLIICLRPLLRSGGLCR